MGLLEVDKIFVTVACPKSVGMEYDIGVDDEIFEEI